MTRDQLNAARNAVHKIEGRIKNSMPTVSVRRAAELELQLEFWYDLESIINAMLWATPQSPSTETP